MSVTRLRTIEEAQPLWERMLPHTHSPVVFMAPWWQSVWWKRFRGESELLMMLVDGPDGPVGLAPMVRDGDTLALLGGGDLFDYRDFIVPRGSEDAFCSILFPRLESMDWSALRLDSIREGSPTLRLFPQAAEAAGMSVEIEVEDVAPAAVLPTTWDEYLAALSKKNRHEIRRKIRRLHNAGRLDRRVCESSEQLRPMMSSFLSLLRASNPDKDSFMTADREAFFFDAAEESARRGHLRLELTALDGQPVAACLGFDYSDAYLLYNSGYDPAHSRLSVGIVSKALAIQAAIESGKRVFDFLRGSEDYKYRLGGQDRRIYRLVIRR